MRNFTISRPLKDQKILLLLLNSHHKIQIKCQVVFLNEIKKNSENFLEILAHKNYSKRYKKRHSGAKVNFIKIKTNKCKLKCTKHGQNESR